jgi:Rieske Fe-S protein
LCTYYPNDTSAIEAKDEGVIASCPKCGSTFIFTADGALVNKGPAKMPLKQYQTTLQGARLYISN